MLKEFHNILNKLSKTELIDFKRYLRSSKPANRQKLKEFTDYIFIKLQKNELHELTIKEIASNKEFKYDFSNDIYEYINMFSEILNDFIYTRKFKSTDINKYFFLLEHHSNTGNEKMKSKTDKKLRAQLFNSTEERGLNYFRYLYSAAIIDQKVVQRRKKKIIEGKQNINLHLNNFMMISKYYFCEIISIFTGYIRDQNIFNIAVNTDEIISLSRQIENVYAGFNESQQKDNLVKLFYYQYLCFRSPENISNYKIYRSFLKQVESKLSLDERKNHYNNALNYCIIKDKDNQEFEYNIRELLDLSTIFIQRKYYIQDNSSKFLPLPAFRNIAILGERLKDVSAVEELINKYSHELDPKLKKDFVNYANVFYHNLKHDYRASIKYSFKVPNSYTGFLIDIKRINIINYYSLAKFDHAEKEIHAFRELIRRQKTIPANIKKRFFTFCKYAEKLILKTNSFNTISYARSKLVQEEWFPSKDWLVEKYSELLERKAS